ncbi:MAG: glycyl-radical enzyme activating protein [Bacteroidetes bacterium]|jgi:pyruvate formate lyase activating enzyme|nr:glycyl-radical enzyme activating protein [Bacteroidota bacterium]
MKAIIFDIRSFSVHDGPGIRTSFFFKGCPLRCSWCHNPESQSAAIEVICRNRQLGSFKFSEKVSVGESISLETAIARAKADKLFYEDSGGGITLSGGEPLLQHQFCIALMNAANQEDIHTAIDTSGFAAQEVFQQTVAHARLVLFDLKLMQSALHQHHTTKPNHLILRNFNWLQQQNKPLIIRIPLVENITDSVANFEAIRALISTTQNIERIDLLPYHQSANQKYTNLNKTYIHQNMPAYPADKSEMALQFFADLAPIVSIGA